MMQRILSNERGSVLIVSLLILMVLTLIGIQALDTTDVELAVEVNDRTYKEAMNAADGGGYVVAKTVSQALNESQSPVVPAQLSYIANDGSIDTNPPANDSFYRELIGLDAYEQENELSFTLGTTASAADIERLRVINFAGGGAEFASSYSGVGAAGPKGIYYGIRTQATTPNNSSSQVYVQYMKALGVAGGL